MVETAAISLGVAVVTSVLAYAVTPKPQPQRLLDDLNVSKSEYGIAIPKVYGRQKVPGNVIWSPGIEEDFSKGKGEEGGKNGSFLYSVDFAVALCVGEIQDIGKIWLNNRLVYNPFSSYEDVVEASSEFAAEYLSIYKGSSTQPLDGVISEAEGSSNTPAFRNLVYLVFRNLDLEKYGNIVPQVSAEVIASVSPTLESILLDICSEAGLDSTEVDASALSDINVGGAIFNQDTSPRTFIEELQKIYHFIVVDDSEKIVFKLSNQASVRFVAHTDLDTRSYGEEPSDIYQQVREHTIDLPSSLQIEYPNLDNNYKRSVQTVFKSTATFRNETSFRSSVAMTDSQALTAIGKSLEFYWNQRYQYNNIKLSSRFLDIFAGDLIAMDIRGKNTVLQVIKLNKGANLTVEVDAVNYDGNIDNLEYESPFTYVPPAPPPKADATLILLDTALTNDSLPELAIHASVVSSGWSGGIIQISADTAPFQNIAYVPQVAAIGNLVDALPITDSFVVDRVTKFKVVTTQQLLESIPDTEFYNFNQIAYINQELIAYQNAVLVAANTYEISNIVRGVRGTENLIASHGIGSNFYVLNAGYPFVDIEATSIDQLGQSFEFRAVPNGISPESIASSMLITYQGNRLKPYSPVNPLITKQKNKALRLSWYRRSRKQGAAWLDSSETVPLNEALERYDIEIFLGTTIVRTIFNHPAPFYILSAANQNLLFGSLQNSLTFRVYQKSIYVGRGYPMIANNLPVTRIQT